MRACRRPTVALPQSVMADQPARRSSPPQDGSGPSGPTGARAGGSRPAPDGRGAPRRRPAAVSRSRLALVDRRLLVVAPAGAQPVDLLAGAAAQRAGPDPLQPDLPDPGQGRQRQGDLLHRRLDPGHVQEGDQVPGRRHGRAGDDQLRDPGPVVRQQLRSSRACSQSKSVTIDAQAPNSGPVAPREPDLRLRPDAAAGPAVRVLRPPRGRGGGGAGGLMSFGRSRARRVEASDQHGHVRGRRRDRRGQGGADRDRRLPQDPGQVPQARRPDPARRAAQRPARAPARRCWRARSPARPASRSSRCRPRSSSR